MWRTPPHLPLSPQEPRGHKTNPTATDMDTRDWHGGGDWDDGPWHGGPGFRGIDACVAATGPYGYVTGYVCI